MHGELKLILDYKEYHMVHISLIYMLCIQRVGDCRRWKLWGLFIYNQPQTQMTSRTLKTVFDAHLL